MKEGSPLRLESRVLAKDGRIIHVEMGVSCLQYKGQEHLVAHMRDLTERHRVEEKLLLTQFAVDHAIDGALWARSDGRFYYANPPFADENYFE
jgi:PAS domain-containing protein